MGQVGVGRIEDAHVQVNGPGQHQGLRQERVIVELLGKVAEALGVRQCLLVFPFALMGVGDFGHGERLGHFVFLYHALDVGLAGIVKAGVFVQVFVITGFP